MFDITLMMHNTKLSLVKITLSLFMIGCCCAVIEAQPFIEATVQSGINLSHSNQADRQSEPTDIGAGQHKLIYSIS